MIDRMIAIVRLLRASIAEGIAGTTYDDRVLPAQAPGYAAALAGGRLVGDAMLNRIVLAVTALMEVKSSMGVIVAEQMPRELRCTALGGLSITPTSLAIEQRLAARATACGGGTCGCG